MLVGRIRSIFLSVLLIYASPILKQNGASPAIQFVDCKADAISSAVKAFKNLDGRYFIAGGTCAAISHGITTPVDVIKTKIQANPAKYNKGMINAALDICKEDGIGALGAGLGPTIVGYGIEGAVKFGVYEVMKTVFKELFAPGIAFLLASIIAGAFAAILLCPMESSRIKMVTDPAYEGLGFLVALPKMLKDDGMFASFSGIYAMLAKQIPYTFGKQVSFDVFATTLYGIMKRVKENVSSLKDSQIKWIVSVLSAFCASLVACIFSQPGDMILTKTYNKQSHHGPATSGPEKTTKKIAGAKKAAAEPVKQLSFTEVIESIYKTGGMQAFFTGTGARIVHVGLIITSQLVIYDIVKQLLGLPATGSH